jgi:hypothetical protein
MERGTTATACGDTIIMVMYQHNSPVLKQASAVLLFLFYSICCVADVSGISVENIHAAGIIGRDKLVQIDALNPAETWYYGEFDPNKILVSTSIKSELTTTIVYFISLRIMESKIVYSEESGYDLDGLKRTATWTIPRVLQRGEIYFAKKSSTQKFAYKYSLDELISELNEKERWPYVLEFKISVKRKDHVGKTVEKIKQITLIPDNKANY